MVGRLFTKIEVEPNPVPVEVMTLLPTKLVAVVLEIAPLVGVVSVLVRGVSKA
jgi:hypothetical protein